MKKLFSFIAAALVTLGANAQKSWNFSDSQWEAKDYEETTTIDGLTIAATSSSKKVTIDASKVTVDNVSYTQRLKFGGTGDKDNRHLKFDVDGPCEITVVLSHSSTSGDPRNLNICANTFDTKNYLTQFNVAAGEAKKATYTYKGEATTICIGSANSGINLYAIYVSPIDTSTPQVEDPTAKIGSYNYEEEGYAVTITSETEGATVSYKVGSGSYTSVENGSTVYVKGGELKIKASKDDYRESEEVTVGTLNAAPSSTSPETLIAFNTGADALDKDIEHSYKSVSIPATYIADIYNKNVGLKFRCNKNKTEIENIGNAFSLNVKEGYKVTGVKITAIANRAGIITVSNMYVDGVAVDEFASFDIPSNSGSAIEKEFTELNATKEIAWKLEPGKYDTTKDVDQFNAKIEVTYAPTSETKEVTKYGWATYIPAYAAQFEEDAAYVVTDVNTATGVVTVENVTEVPANTAVLLKGEGMKTITFIESAEAPETNLLSVCNANDSNVDVVQYPYVLAKDGNSAGFKKWVGDISEIEGRVVLWLSTEISTARSFFALDGEATGIKSVASVATQDGAVYDLQGRRVAQPKAGLYIVNGKKVVVK